MILDDIANATRKRVAFDKTQKSLEEVKQEAIKMKKNDFLFEKALKKDGLSFICEIKKASPSKGIIAEDFPYQEIAKEYEMVGADCISVLTEPDYFMGNDLYLKQISQLVNTPLLRKDFTVDEYQIYQAKLLGASAILLICALLDTKTIHRFSTIAEGLGLSVLVEAHNEQEIRSAVDAGARIIGVNNRNLKTFEVDIENCVRYRKMVPSDTIFVAESGIKTREDILHIEANGIDAVLIGETFMKSDSKKQTLDYLRGI